MDLKQQEFEVYGEMTIPFSFVVSEKSKEEALKKVAIILNNDNIECIEADIHTASGNAHLLLAQNCKVTLFEVIADNDI